jgi:hypothetical protein
MKKWKYYEIQIKIAFDIYSDEGDIIHFSCIVVFWVNSDGIDDHCLLVHIRSNSAQLSDNDIQYI